MTTPIVDPCIGFNLDAIKLLSGSHGDTFTGEVCLVEASCAATMCDPVLQKRFGAPKTFGDDHPSISRVVRLFGMGLNDAWNDENRQRLKPYALKILGTKTTDADEETRAWLAVDWLARVHTPAFLRLAGLEEHARALEGLARIADATTARSAQPSLDAARDASAAAGDAALAARDVARAAARDAAWAAAGDAAWAAARDALRPAVVTLQASALDLFDAMINMGRVA